jgi:ubiquinone/menaquinone biosynthesis C-methylase UbiE
VYKGKKAEGWVEYWKREDATNEVMSRVNMEFFLRATHKILSFDSGDILLDIGCGYCHLAEALETRVSATHCADISDYYLERARDRFVQSRNVFFYKLREDDYTNLGMLGVTLFTKVVCLSVVQYYRGIEELEKLILEVRRVSRPGAKFIIADIPDGRVSYKDTISTVICAAKAGKLFDACSLFFKAYTQNYRGIYRKVGLLKLEKSQLLGMGKRLNIKMEILRDRLTINSKRMHLLIEF